MREILFVNPDKETLIERAKTLFGDASIAGQQSSHSSNVKIIGTNLSNFLSQGYMLDRIGAYGRPMPKEIQHVHLST